MPVGNLIKKLVGGKLLEGAETVANIADKFIQTKEEKEAFQLELLKAKADIELKAATLEKDIDEMYLKDAQSARDTNARIQESENASWLAKNIAYCIDAAFVIAFFIGLILIYNKAVPESNKELFYTGFGALTSYVATILNFHRGTSIGSKVNGDALRKQLNK